MQDYKTIYIPINLTKESLDPENLPHWPVWLVGKTLDYFETRIGAGYGINNKSNDGDKILILRIKVSQKDLAIKKSENVQHVQATFQNAHIKVSRFWLYNREVLKKGLEENPQQYAKALEESSDDENESQSEKSPLFPQKADAQQISNYGALTRWLSRDLFIRKLLLYPILGPSAAGNNKERLQSRLHYLFRTATIPQQNTLRRALAQVTTNFFDGAAYITDELWPLIFSGLLLHDVVVYAAQPDKRFGNNIGKILIGDSHNEVTLSDHFGLELFGEYAYWLWPALIFTATISSGLMQVLSRIYYGSSLLRSRMDINDELGEDNERRIQHLLENMRSNRDQFTFVLRHAEQLLLWDGRLTHYERTQLLVNIPNLTNDDQFFKQHRAMQALAAIADSFTKPNQQIMHDLPGHQQLPQLAKDAVDQLDNLSKNSHRRLTRWYANYLLWSLGHTRKSLASILALMGSGLTGAYIFYAKIRLFELWLETIINTAKYYHDKHDCHEQGKIWSYLEEFGDYYCNACADWSFMFIGEIFTPEQCWQGLFAGKRSVSQLISGITRLTKHFHYHPSELDLSQQPLANYTIAEWNALFTAIQENIASVQTLNISQPLPNPRIIDNEKVKVLVDFLTSAPIKVVDISNSYIGDTIFQELLPAFNSSAITELVLSGCDLTDASIDLLVSNLPPQLQILNLANNDLGQDTVNQLSNALTQSNDTVVEVDLSGNDFTTVDISPLWKITQQSRNIQRIAFSNCNLSDSQLVVVLPYLNESSIQQVTFANNQFSDTGVTYFVNALTLSNNSVSAVDFSQNAITDVGLSDFSPLLPQTNIKELGLSQNLFSQVGLDALMAIVPETQINTLLLSGMNLGDASLNSIVQAANSSQSKLTTIDLSNNGITDAGGVILVEGIFNNSIQRLGLRNNALSNLTADAIARRIPQSAITDLDLGNNNIGQAAQKIFDAIAHSNATNIDISDNPCGENIGASIITALIKTPIRYLSADILGHQHLSLDQKRALHHRAKPRSSHLQRMNLANIDADEASLRMIARVMPLTSFTPATLQLSANATNDAVMQRSYQPAALRLPSLAGAQANANTQLNLLLGIVSGVGLVILAIVLLYLIYRAVERVSYRGLQKIGIFANDKIALPNNSSSETYVNSLKK